MAAENQVAISRAVLSQQLAEIDNGSSLSDSEDAGNANAGGMPVTPANFPFFRRGPVGYQPVIITLPQTSTLFATAVVSADRRYVRISPVPFFSAIGPVSTFNFATGQSGTSGSSGGGSTGGGTGGSAAGGGTSSSIGGGGL